jgi:hypothetical protein
MKKTGLNTAFAFIILLLALPAVQMQFHFFNELTLDGAFTLTEKPVFDKGKWMNGAYQGEMETYLKDHSGFRNFLVKLQNQVDFSFFRQANAEGAVIGKNNQLFEYDYIRSWLAIDYPGDSFLDKKLQRMKYVQEYLKREKNIDLVFVFEPGKASFYPKYLPEKYSRLKSGPSTYERYRKRAAETGIDFIDFQEYFLKLKPGSEFPLFPRYGTHWSVFGMRFAADSLLNLIEKKRGITLTEVSADTTETSYIPRDTDDDVLKTMNLLFHKQGELLAYPKLVIDTLHPGEKPMVLVIADSYYWNIFNTRIPKYVFANQAFWYFNTLVYPDHYLAPTYTKNVNLKEEVEKQQVIFVMITERFLHKCDWRFVDQLYALYTPEWLQDRVYDNINNIMQVAPWYADIIAKAQRRNISLEQALIDEGKYLYYNADTSHYMIDFGPDHYKNVISSSPLWMSHIRKKAEEQGKPVDEVLAEDAVYTFKTEHPVMFELYNSRVTFLQKIKSDTRITDSLYNEADKLHFDRETYLNLVSWKLLKEDEMEKTRNAILSDPNWLNDVRKKADSKGLSEEEMIRLDGEYMYNQKLKYH